MTDKKLLELAAKAAGIQIDYSRFNGGGAGNTGFDLSGNAVLDWHNYKTWNPLTDDGDALRLAVKMKIVPSTMADTVVPSRSASWRSGSASFSLWEPAGQDPYAATRRAIVRAAAEIGKALP